MESLKRPLRQWLWNKLGLQWRFPSGVSIKVASVADWYIYNEIFVTGEYDAPLRDLINDHSSPKKSVVLDLGCNVGFVFLRWLHFWRAAGSPGTPPAFILVEGAKKTYEELLKRLHDQPSDGVDISSWHRLVGERHGQGRISESHIHFANRLVPATGAGDDGEFLDLVTLCEPYSRISLLKCDIEGSEQILIDTQPEIFQKADRAVVEFHHAQCDRTYCLQKLAAAGLTHTQILHETADFSVVYLRRNP